MRRRAGSRSPPRASPIRNRAARSIGDCFGVSSRERGCCRSIALTCSSAHYMPPFSRLGAYDPAVLERAVYGRDRMLFEYCAHEASLVPLELHPLLRWRMERARRAVGTWRRPLAR